MQNLILSELQIYSFFACIQYIILWYVQIKNRLHFVVQEPICIDRFHKTHACIYLSKTP